MAESYLCLGEYLHFSNGGGHALQKAWLSLGEELELTDGWPAFRDLILKYNAYGQGCRAFDIDDAHKEFEEPSSLICWLKTNEALIEEIKEKGSYARIYEGDIPLSLQREHIHKLRKMSEGIKQELKKMQE